MKVFITTLGCKLNESELEAWARQFAASGAEVVAAARDAELCVVNTCTVTQHAARKSRGLVKKLAHASAAAPIVVTGCYATLSPAQVCALPNVALVVPNRDKDQVVALAGGYWRDTRYRLAEGGCRLPEAASGELASENVGQAGGSPHPRTRAFVKIQDGCNMTCTYCIIPFARGRARSRPQDEIVAQVRQLVAEGYQEVILTGVQISDYCLEERDAGGSRLRGLCRLLRALLDETELPRLRLTSIAPWAVEPELLELFADARLCRQLHLSLQSGSNTVLHRMRRPYTAERFRDAAAMARAVIGPDVAITTDVIVGFPGETELEFGESLDFVEHMEFSRVHVFPYSARGGTVAAQLPLQVAAAAKDARVKAMQAVADASAQRFAQKFVGHTRAVLYEAEESTPGLWSGYTDNYIRVVAPSDKNLANRLLPTRIEQVSGDGARGSLSP